MLTIKNLYKLYPNSKKITVTDISFSVPDGEICGFLGMNGTGKSTTIKCVTGIIPYSHGEIKINGFDIASDTLNAKMNFGFVPDNHAVYSKLTGREYVNYMADLYKVSKEDRKKTLELFLDKFNLTRAIDNQIASYSHGMKQKICIIAALIHKPKLWILDEPMVGLDPQSIFEVKEYMREHKKSGGSVFFSSHSLDTAEKLCDRAVIIHNGRLLDIFDLNKFRKENISLEEKFLALTKQADLEQKQDEENLKALEKELAAKYGAKKAGRMLIAQAQDKIKALNALPAEAEAGE